eukprot:6564940-Pyramimonas_sp.AAC.1
MECPWSGTTLSYTRRGASIRGSGARSGQRQGYCPRPPAYHSQTLQGAIASSRALLVSIRCGIKPTSR